MSSQYKFENHSGEIQHQSKVKLTDLLSRINEEKKLREIKLSLKRSNFSGWYSE